MEALKCIGGFVLGFCLPPALAWLFFVSPFYQGSLRGFWISLGIGVAVSVAAIIGAAVLIAKQWPTD